MASQTGAIGQLSQPVQRWLQINLYHPQEAITVGDSSPKNGSLDTKGPSRVDNTSEFATISFECKTKRLQDYKPATDGLEPASKELYQG